MLALGDGIVDHGYAQRRITSISLSTRSSRVASDSASEERYRRQDEIMQNLMQSQQHILVILHVRVSYMLNLSNSI
jgi:hypothetical protein